MSAAVRAPILFQGDRIDTPEDIETDEELDTVLKRIVQLIQDASLAAQSPLEISSSFMIRATLKKTARHDVMRLAADTACAAPSAPPMPAAPAAPRLSAVHIKTLSQIFDLGEVTQTQAWPAAAACGGLPAVPARTELRSAEDSLIVPQSLLDDLIACGLVQSYGGLTDAGIELLNAKDLVAAA